jgi:hypothetical protein
LGVWGEVSPGESQTESFRLTHHQGLPFRITRVACDDELEVSVSRRSPDTTEAKHDFDITATPGSPGGFSRFVRIDWELAEQSDSPRREGVTHGTASIAVKLVVRAREPSGK